MQELKSRLDQLQGQRANLVMQINELDVLINAYENTIKEKDEAVGK